MGMRVDQPRNESLAPPIDYTNIFGGTNVWSNLLDLSVAHENRGSQDDTLAIENSRIFDQDVLRSEKAWRYNQKQYQTYRPHDGVHFVDEQMLLKRKKALIGLAPSAGPDDLPGPDRNLNSDSITHRLS